jgi:hypothetical protein
VLVRQRWPLRGSSPEQFDYTRGGEDTFLNCGDAGRTCSGDRDGAALGAALAGEFEKPHDVESPFGGNRELRFAKDGVTEVGIEIAEVGDDVGNAAVRESFAFGERQNAPVGFGFGAPGNAGYDAAETEIAFLRVDVLLDERAFGAMQNEMLARRDSEDRGTQVDARATGVVEDNVEGIVHEGAFALDANVGGEGGGHAEEGEREIEDVRRNVEENPGARAGALAPGAGFEVGAVAVVVAFEADDAAEFAAGGELFDELEVAIVAAILVDGNEAALLFGELDEGDGFFESGGEGLVYEDIAAGGEALLGEGKVRIVGSGDDNQTDFADGEQLFERANDADAGKFFGGFVAGALKDGRQAEARDGTNDRGVESASGEAESDEADVNHSRV